MADSGSRKQITFDLRLNSLKECYPHGELTSSPQYYTQAYHDIRRFMYSNGFEHRQSSAYVSTEKLTALDIVLLMERLAAELPWLSRCVNEIDVTDIGARHSLKKILEDASRLLDIELGDIHTQRADLGPTRSKHAKAKRKAHVRER